MNLQDFLNHVNSGKTVVAGSEMHQYMCMLSQEALRLTAELNNSYRTPEEIREIFSELTGKPVDKSFGMFPPFTTDCRKNIILGKMCGLVPMQLYSPVLPLGMVQSLLLVLWLQRMFVRILLSAAFLQSSSKKSLWMNRKKRNCAMQYKKFKNKVSLSRLGMGAMRLPVKGSNAEIDYEKAKAIIDAGMKSGINYYDTAYIYHGGKSEEFFGEVLKACPRDSFYVADKYNLQAEPDFEHQFAEQLRRLQMDHIDFYLLHGIQDSFADDILSNGCIAYFDWMKQEGKIRYLGFSFHIIGISFPMNCRSLSGLL